MKGWLLMESDRVEVVNEWVNALEKLVGNWGRAPLGGGFSLKGGELKTVTRGLPIRQSVGGVG